MLARFWAKIERGGPDDCWHWNVGTDGAGYGKLKIAGRDVGAHCIAYEIAHGHIQPGLFALHSCHNLPCCNPAHVNPGTPRRNQVEAVERGRRPKGLRGRHPWAKLTNEQVEAIRSSGLPSVVLATQFGVAKSTITIVRNGPSSTE